MSPFIVATSTCTLPCVRGRGLMLPLPLLGGTWELILCPPPPIEEGGAYFCPSLSCLPLSSPHSHGSSSHVPHWVISCSLPPWGDTRAHPVSPVKGGHGSLSHVPLKREGEMGDVPVSLPLVATYCYI